jgi:hypothetical protein
MIPKEAEMEFKRALDTSELPEGKMAIVVVDGTEVLLANVGGNYHQSPTSAITWEALWPTASLREALSPAPDMVLNSTSRQGNLFGKPRSHFSRQE